MIRKKIAMVLVIGLATASPGTPAMAADRKLPGQVPAPIERMLSCRSVAATDARLACFEKNADAIAAAISARDLVMIDKAKAQATRRELFGLSIPSFGGLFGGDDDKDQIKQIESKIATARRNADGGWFLTLADGSVWSQTDDSVLGLSPKPAMAVVVRKGALGSFRISVAGQPGFKASRVR